MEEIDKDLLDKVKLYIDESWIIHHKVADKPMSVGLKEILTNRCKLVYVYAEMETIYERGIKVRGLLSKMKFS